MNILMKWLLAKVFQGLKQTVKTNSSHLPGLTPLKPAPFQPQRSKPVAPPESDYNELYQRFKKGNPKNKKRQKKRGLND